MCKGKGCDEGLKQRAGAMTPGHNQDFGLCFKCSGKLFKRFIIGKDMDRFMFDKDNSESL